MPLNAELLIETGVNVRNGVSLLLDTISSSAICARISTALSRIPFVLFNTSELRLASVKPMSRKVFSFWSKLLFTLVILIPKIWLGLLDLVLAGSAARSFPLYVGERGGVNTSLFRRPVNEELDERKLNPNFLPGFGGNGGGSSPNDPVLVLPV